MFLRNWSPFLRKDYSVQGSLLGPLIHGTLWKAIAICSRTTNVDELPFEMGTYVWDDCKIERP